MKTRSNLSRTSLETAQAPNSTVYALGEILAALGLPETMATWEQLASDLSKLAHKKPAWGKKYIHNVYLGHLEPSKALIVAVEKLGQRVDGAIVGTEGMAYVKVLADPGRVGEGVLIPASAVVVKCARPGCPVHFVKIHPNQKYHDPGCRV